jgi:uncharacterized protein
VNCATSVRLGLILAAAILFGGCGGSAGTGDPKVREARAQSLVKNLAAGDYDEARKYFNLIMRVGMSSSQLKAVWEGLQKQAGEFRRPTWSKEKIESGYNIVWVGCEFEKATMKTRVVFGSEDKITGLFFVPWNPPWKAPDYGNGGQFIERGVEFGDPAWRVNGTFTIPKAVTNAPVVVLIHGSGPQDRDSTVGSNKPFKDLAWGLASRGIAVLRYEKRTRQHQGKLAQTLGFTVKEETVDDAVYALKWVRTKSGHSNRVYLAGHSLGGYLAPRIARRAEGLDGIILLAGNARPMEQLMLEQLAYLARIQGQESADRMAGLRREAEQIGRLSAADRTKRHVVLGAPVSYWLDLKNYRPVAQMQELKLRTLVLQGERDYQVTFKDFALWKAGLDGGRATFRLLPKLNHLFMTGERTSEPIEYQNPGHVDEVVIDAIAEWIALEE